MSTGCKSSHSGFLNVSRSNGGLRISRWIGQLSYLTISPPACQWQPSFVGLAVEHVELWRHDKRFPSYLSDAVQTIATTDYVVPHTISKFSERAFAHAGPTAWNRLPEHIRRQSTPATFRRHLKTFLFVDVFNTTYNSEHCNVCLVADLKPFCRRFVDFQLCHQCVPAVILHYTCLCSRL